MSDTVKCPNCNHRFRALKCQCKGYIVNAESWKLGRWDWRPVFKSMSDNCRPSDIDGIIERGGHFLVFETKELGKEVDRGQMRLLLTLSRLPGVTVVILWGHPDRPEFWQVIGKIARRATTPEELHEFVDAWFSDASHKAVS